MDKIINAISTLTSQQDPHAPLCAYIYDLEQLRSHANAMVKALPSNCELYYAAKANPEAEVLAALAPIVHGFEASLIGCINVSRRCR